MKYEILRSGGIDVTDALNRFSGSNELLEKYLNRFIEEKSYTELVIAMERADYAAAENAVHSLKGVTGSLGMTSLFQSSCALLAAFRDKKEELFSPLLEEIKVKYEEISAVIKNSL
ncbi:MAG TPA: Hpt domain-containing protein [Treponemataceae bacterium]|nr:Hpt domain-containing protein [Treponemataceae bacterium]